MEEEEKEEHHRIHRQHAIPQHIGAFKFKLVGQLTLKQFAYFGGFGFLAWLILASKLFPLVKFPLASLFAAIGTALAFLPIAGQPMDKMLVAFTKVLSSPTQRVWIKKGQLPAFLQPAFGKPRAEPVLKTQASRKILEKYLSQFAPKPTQAEVAEEAFISRLDFGVSLPAKVALAAAEVTQAKPKVEEETLAGITLEERRPVTAAVVPLAAAVNFVERPVITVPSPVAGPAILTPIGEVKVRKLRSRPDLSAEFFLRRVRGEKKFEVSPELRAILGLEPELPQVPTLEQQVSPLETAMEELVSQPAIKVKSKPAKPIKVSKRKADRKGEAETKTQEFVQVKVIPPPPIATPTQPNLIAGVVKDKKGHLLEGVILIVKNENGAPVRAFKTNLLGQFSISTPLANGKYTIHPEKEGYKFSIIEFEAKGEIIKPIEIVAED